MQRHFFLLVALLLAPLAFACSDDDSGGKLRVVAITTQIGDFATNIGGDRISLTVLLKPNQEAHDFEPEPSQARRIAEADLVLRNGLGLDDFVEKALSGSDAEVVEVADGIRARQLEGEDDPHVWFSVANARTMVEKIAAALADADPPNAAFYQASAAKYLEALTRLESEIEAGVQSVPARCRKLVTNHDVLGYYAEAYGFTVVGSVIPATSTEAQASASDVAGIVRRIKAEGVPAVFAEIEVNPSLIRQVGREAGVKVVDDLYGDSLGTKGSDGATYIGMMQANTKKIVEALRGC